MAEKSDRAPGLRSVPRRLGFLFSGCSQPDQFGPLSRRLERSNTTTACGSGCLDCRKTQRLRSVVGVAPRCGRPSSSTGLAPRHLLFRWLFQSSCCEGQYSRCRRDVRYGESDMGPVNLLATQMLNEMDQGEQKIEKVRPQRDPIADAFDTNWSRSSQGDRRGGDHEQASRAIRASEPSPGPGLFRTLDACDATEGRADGRQSEQRKLPKKIPKRPCCGGLRVPIVARP